MSQKKFLLIMFSLVAIGLVVVGGIYTSYKKENIKLQTSLMEKEKEVPVPPVVTKTTVNIISVGDIFIHQSNLDSVYNPKDKTYNFDPNFSAIASYFKEADLATAWLGGVMDNSGPYSGYPSFKSPASLVETLKNIGLDIVFRTNHTLDFGTKGFNTTTTILKENNINQVAAYTTEEESENIFIYQKDDLKISFLGYIYGMNGIPIPEKWMINLIDLEKIKSDVAKAREQSDFVVVALHFGNEYERYPNSWQRNIALQVADSGVDMIIGSHPHVLQPTEIIDTKDGRKVFVAYGLGNFFCGQRQHYTDYGMILKYTIEKEGETTILKEFSYIPTWVSKYLENGKYQFKILPSKKYLELYKEGNAGFLSPTNYTHLLETYQETIKHLDNQSIGFSESQ